MSTKWQCLLQTKKPPTAVSDVTARDWRAFEVNEGILVYVGREAFSD